METKKHLFSLAVGILTLAACTSEEIVDVSPTQGRAIGFDNVVNKNTRAVEGDLTATTFDNFLVYGYYLKAQNSNPIQIFNGVDVKKGKNSTTGKDEWTYSDKRYWIPDCTYYFYAYSCADVALTTGKGNPNMTLLNTSSVDQRALSITSYLCDGTHQHDLVYAESEGYIAKENGNNEVALGFSHALCKIQAVFTTDFPSGYEIQVSNVRISEFDNRGDFNVGTGVWSGFKSEENLQPINLEITGNNTLNSSNNAVETKQVFLIPKQYSTSIENVKIHFSIKVSKDGQEVLQRNINGTWAPQWEKSRIYKYSINITGSSAGIEPIVFAASQSLSGNNDWDTTTDVKMEFGVDTNS